MNVCLLICPTYGTPNTCSLICPTYGTPNTCSSCPAAVPKNGQNVCSWNAAQHSQKRAAKSSHYLRSESSQDLRRANAANILFSSTAFQKRITFLFSRPKFVVISIPLVSISTLVIAFYLSFIYYNYYSTVTSNCQAFFLILF